MSKRLTNIKILKEAKQNEMCMNDLIYSDDAEKFIKFVIKSYTKSPTKFMLFNRIEFEELMQLGHIGLFKAIKDVDMTKTSNEIQRYLYMRIQGEIREVARSNNSNQLVVSQRIRGMYPSYLKYHQNFYETNYRDPTIKEVMRKFAINMDDAYDLVYGMQATISELAESDGESVSLFEILSIRYFNLDQSVENQVINRIVLEEKLSVLRDKERKVLEMKYISGYSNTEIAKYLGCANSMITKHLSNAFNRLAAV